MGVDLPRKEPRLSRYARATDRNQAEIARVLRKAGVKVADLSRCGAGIPDLLCHRNGWGFALLECKTKHGSLTPDQRAWHALWPVHIVRSPEEALRAVGL